MFFVVWYAVLFATDMHILGSSIDGMLVSGVNSLDLTLCVFFSIFSVLMYQEFIDRLAIFSGGNSKSGS